MSKHIEQYNAYLQDLGNMGVRHENSRSFYLSVVSALFVFLSMAGDNGTFIKIQSPVLTLTGLVGILLCIVWAVHMQTFGAIYRAKFDVLRMMEKEHSLFHVFDEEYKFLKANPCYKFLTFIDSITPVLFLFIFVALLYFKQLV